MESRSIKIFSQIDWLTVIIYLLMIAGGVFTIYAASFDFDGKGIFDFDQSSGRQILWIGLAITLAVILLLFDYRVYETCAYPIYLALILILILTVFIAPNINGSHSWLVFGPIRFQPAEFGKFATSLALAKLFSTYGFKLNASYKNYLRALLIILLPVGIIIIQNETGSALAYTALFLVLYREGMSGLVLLAALCAVVFFVVAIKYSASLLLGLPLGEAVVFMMIMLLMVSLIALYTKRFIVARNVIIWFAGMSVIETVLYFIGYPIPGLWFFLGTIGVACIYCFLVAVASKLPRLHLCVGAIIASILFLFFVNYAFTSVLKPHQRDRIKDTLGMEENVLGIGYNVNQSKIAIGSGGLFGKGYLQGTQTKLKYVPEQHTDFIFCTVGEEEGFVGTSAVLLLFLILILRIIHIAERQPTIFGRVYAYCVASFFILHLAINIGMVIGLCPVIGIPLPFFSYGGSSLWSFTILLFILLRIDATRKDHHRSLR